MVAISLAGVHRSFDVDTVPVRALRGVDLQVEDGEFVAVTGPSGSGKSTLLQIIAGLQPADEGTVIVAGTRLDELGHDERAVFRGRHVGIVFQFFNLVRSLSVVENVELAASLSRRRRSEARDRAAECLDLVGLGERQDSPVAALSGGQRQRLAIARALANDPVVLLADEPTGALDSQGGQEMTALLAHLNARGLTVLLVTHDPQVAASATRRLDLRDGSVVQG